MPPVPAIDRNTLVISAELTAYCEASTSTEPPLCRYIRDAAQKHPNAHWTTGPLVGTLLEMLVSISGGRRVLDIGTFLGYSAAYLASAHPEVQVLSLEASPSLAKTARKMVDASRLASQIRIENVDAIAWLKGNQGREFDLVFFDTVRQNLMEIYEPLLKAVAPGGVLVMDNAFVRGNVLTPSKPRDHATVAFNARLQKEPGFLTTVLPIRDGLLLAHKLPSRENTAKTSSSQGSEGCVVIKRGN